MNPTNLPIERRLTGVVVQVMLRRVRTIHGRYNDGVMMVL
jgi:hypothetical protein